ncbi:MAG TPA: hypothetical protein DEB39_00585, partial [Planctomycetaceae bacterium]|nr:hypothetical protein [Planctomycetaceae bacterium]
IGKIGAAIQQEEFARILQTADQESDEYKVAQTYLQLMENETDRDEMAVPIQHLLDEIGLNTGHQNAVGAMKNLSRNVAARQRVHIAVASEEQRRKDAYTEGFSQTVLTRIADSLGEGATFEEIVNAAFQMIDVDPESDLMQAHQHFTEANARVRRLEIERDEISRNRNISDEKRQELLGRNDVRRTSAVQNLGDAQANLQPELRKMRFGFERMSTAEFDAKFRMDLDTLNQVMTVEDQPGGKFKLRKLQRDEVRIDAESGIMQVREGNQWVDKQDASYFAQMTRKAEKDEEEHYFKELFRENGRWKYLDDGDSFVDFDPNAEGAKMAVGTKILTRAQDGSVKASNYQWTNGFLTKTSEDGRSTNVVADSDGQLIRMDSELGKAIYTSSDDGVLNQDLIRAIESNRSDLVTVLDAKTLSQGKAAQRHAAAAADESKVSIQEQRIRDLANQYVDSTGAIGEIEPVKVEMEGETFYMLSGYGNKDARRIELEKYREEQARQKEEITAYFEANDSDTKKYVLNENEPLRETRKAYRANKAIRERILGRTAANKAKLLTPLDEGEAKAVQEEIHKDESTLTLLEPVGTGTIEQAAKEQARLERIDIQSEQVRDLSEAAITATVTDPKLLEAVAQYGGSGMPGRRAASVLDEAVTPETSPPRFTAVELADVIGAMREAVKSLPAAEQGVMDVYVQELTRKKTEVQNRAAQTLRETFSEQGGSGIQIIDMKTADPVQKDRFGDPIVVTPIPRKEPLEMATEPTDIRQVRIGSGTYDAVSGLELNTPVRAVAKRAVEIPQATAPMQVATEPIPQQPPRTGTIPPVVTKKEATRIEGRSTPATSDSPKILSPVKTDSATPARLPRPSHSPLSPGVEQTPGPREKTQKPAHRTAPETEARPRQVGLPFSESYRSELSSLNTPLRKKPGRIEPPTLQIDDLATGATSIDSVGDVSEHNFKVVGHRLEAPAISRTSGTPLPTGPGTSGFAGRECTLHANTVNFRVDSMDLKNGSVVVESVGRGHRNGTSEQR